MNICIHKFGGASLENSAAFQQVLSICRNFIKAPSVVVASATGKSTNELEDVLDAHRNNNNDKAVALLREFKSRHIQLAIDLLGNDHAIIDELNDQMVEAEWILEDEAHPDYDYEYDQLICIGELISSMILCAVLKENGLDALWMDAREVIKTDSVFREASVNWQKTQEKVEEAINPLISKNKIVVTQGFIGATPENESTTLGREGSDYSAAVFGYCLDANEISIWKDVPGILNADPNLFDQVSKIDRLSYREAVEMSYYGAKVIHPKTIKPLENKRIPLWVRSFVNPESSGTQIGDHQIEFYPPVIVIENNQTLIHISPKDFSFIAEHHLSELFAQFNQHRIKVNMMQNTAISFSVCVNNFEERVNKFVENIRDHYNVIRDADLELITIRHYDDESLSEQKKGKIVLFEEYLKDTVQLVVKQSVKPVRKEKN